MTFRRGTSLATSGGMAKRRKIRYAVVGLGHIAQVAVIPAFRHAGENSELAALVSSDKTKLEELGQRYQIDELHSYGSYHRLLKSGAIDAVYVALPNHLHRDFTVRAARAGVHVLCEKPMAVTESDCRAMISAADANRVKLMIAYRLHFEEANLSSIRELRRGSIGDPRLFSSVFTMDVREGDIRLRKKTGGGTLFDIGIYCINAARYLLRDEPFEALAMSARKRERRFAEVEEMVSATLRFPGERVATFICSFGASDVARLQVVGTKGNLQLDPAYEYAAQLKRKIVAGGRESEKTYSKRDQFAPELVYFSNCILQNTEPEPSGREGLADVRIIEALYRSARLGRSVRIRPLPDKKRPDMRQHLRKPPVQKPQEIKVQPPSK